MIAKPTWRGANVGLGEQTLLSQFHATIRSCSLTALPVLFALTGCTAVTPVFRDVAPITGPTPYVNRTPMHAALICVRSKVASGPDIRFGIADFIDGSGASMGDSDVQGKYFSQRPDLMLVVALSKAGVHLVNRSSTGVAEWEMRQAMDKRLGDGKPTMVGNTRFDYRPVRAGGFLGSNYYIHGAITEINWNISSDANEVGMFGLTVGRRTYRVSMAIDLVVSSSTTTEVIFARSYSKQLVGYETGAGVFRFVNAAVLPSSAVELFQANIGQKQNEPVQQALRWLVETAGYDVVSQIYGRDPKCDQLVPGAEADDSVADGAPVQRDAAVPAIASVQTQGAINPPVPVAEKRSATASPSAETVAAALVPSSRTVERTRRQYTPGNIAAVAIAPAASEPEDGRSVVLLQDAAIRRKAAQAGQAQPVTSTTSGVPGIAAVSAPVEKSVPAVIEKQILPQAGIEAVPGDAPQVRSSVAKDAQNDVVKNSSAVGTDVVASAPGPVLEAPERPKRLQDAAIRRKAALAGKAQPVNSTASGVPGIVAVSAPVEQSVAAVIEKPIRLQAGIEATLGGAPPVRSSLAIYAENDVATYSSAVGPDVVASAPGPVATAPDGPKSSDLLGAIKSALSWWNTERGLPVKSKPVEGTGGAG